MSGNPSFPDSYMTDLDALFSEKRPDIDEIQTTLKQLEIESSRDKKYRDAFLKYENKLVNLKRSQLLGDETVRPKTPPTRDILLSARQQLVDTEGLARDTVAQLSTQRESLLRVKANVKETNAQLGVADRFASALSRWWRG